MRLPRYICPLLAVCLQNATAVFLGPTYPAPMDLSSNNSLVHKSWQNLTAALYSYLAPGSNTSQSLQGGQDTAFSLGLFSTQDVAAAATLQYHYTPPMVANSTNGTQKIDGDSIYRIASVSKLITTFTGLIELTADEWNRPLVSIIPEIATFARQQQAQSDVIDVTSWDEITPWSLASQLSGVATLGLPAADYLSYGEAIGNAYGFPSVNSSGFGACWNLDRVFNCTISESIESIRWLPPNFLPFSTAAYSDEGFMLLGAAIAALRNKSMADIYQDSVFEPFGMASSFSSPPIYNPCSVMPAATYANFSLDIPFTTPSGGLFSTINDLAKFGVGILNSTLLAEEKTRRWMKPETHTASLTYSVGAPWEIIRYVHPSTGKVTDLYTKLGDSGDYGGIVVLIPDYNAGFSMLNAGGSDRSSLALAILDIVADAVLPALEAQATAEATRNLAGTYIPSDPKLNSSFTVGFNETSGGLVLTGWISNSTDMLAVPEFFADSVPQLLPTIRSDLNHPDEIAFRASINPQLDTYYAPGASALGATGPFSGFYYTNFDWLTAGQKTYAGVPIDLFVFEVDRAGYATAVRTAATRTTLRRAT